MWEGHIFDTSLLSYLKEGQLPCTRVMARKSVLPTNVSMVASNALGPGVQCALFVHAHNRAPNHLFIWYPLIFLAIRTLYFMVGFDHAGQRTSHFVRASD